MSTILKFFIDLSKKRKGLIILVENLFSTITTSTKISERQFFSIILINSRRSYINLYNLIMDKVTKIWLGPLPADSPYLKPFRMYYIQNGVEKNWDMIKVHDSVSIIIFNKSRNRLVLVKQFRPAVFYAAVISKGDSENEIDLKKFPPALGLTVELCAGIVDKSKSWKEIAQEEVLEECGYNVPLENIEEVLTMRSGVGHSGALQTMYYCEVTDDQKTSDGGGIDDELIEIVEYTIEQARDLLKQGNRVESPPSFLFGILWFLTHKASKFQNS